MNTMSCMKCGREISLGQVFCKDCLEDMSRYPVNPATPVQIPLQPPAVHTSRRPTKKSKKPEEQVLRLRKVVRIQATVILCLLTIIFLLGFYGYKKFYTPGEVFRPGENYNSTDSFLPSAHFIP